MKAFLIILILSVFISLGLADIVVTLIHQLGLGI